MSAFLLLSWFEIRSELCNAYMERVRTGNRSLPVHISIELEAGFTPELIVHQFGTVPLPQDHSGTTGVITGVPSARFTDNSGGGWVFDTRLDPTGTITQAAGSKANGVTINNVTGQVTTSSAALAGNTEVAFAVTNNTVDANDSVVLSVASGGTARAYGVRVSAVSSGSFVVRILNLTGGSLSEAIVINFAVQKAK
jgi:hypothetical protein